MRRDLWDLSWQVAAVGEHEVRISESTVLHLGVSHRVPRGHALLAGPHELDPPTVEEVAPGFP